MFAIKRIINKFFLLFLIAFLSCNPNKEEKGFYNQKFSDVIKESRKELAVFKQINYVPSISIAVSLNGELIWSEAYGLASTDLDVPATRKTKYRIGAISEVLTALTYNILTEQGKLNPDSLVHSYLPEFKGKVFDLPLKYLANQSSGIRPENMNEIKWSAYGNSIETGLILFENDTLLFEPGLYQLPSIFNYNLLGAVIQKAENKKFAEVVNKVVLDTLGLTNTVPDNPFITIKNRPDFFDHNYVSQVINASTKDLSYKLPSRGYLSTVDDLIKLGNAFLYSDYISDTIKIKTFRVDEFPGEPSNWANGWFIVDNNTGYKIYGSRGSEVGGGAGLLIYPEQNFVITILTNVTDDSNSIPIFKIANLFLEKINKEK
ncbi:MAG: beta-lactamase family protein [Prolixibacteraceae bacterium]|nr:beta-lactamase family protein [Prolixibacteraceae bacterium]